MIDQFASAKELCNELGFTETELEQLTTREHNPLPCIVTRKGRFFPIPCLVRWAEIEFQNSRNE